MTSEGKDYIWTQREGETTRAYQAFRSYLKLGPGRKIGDAVTAEGRSSRSQYENWSSQWSWRERCEAHDRHIARAETDGLVNELAPARDKQIRISDKLLDLVSDRIDYYASRNQDPSIRVIQALSVAAKVQKEAFSMTDTDKTSDMVENAYALLERLEEHARNHNP